MDLDEQINKIEDTVDTVNANEFKRCFEPEEETFYKEKTGNLVLNKNCTFCSYRFDCWPDMVELPAVKSKAKQPKTVAYIKLAEEYKSNAA